MIELDRLIRESAASAWDRAVVLVDRLCDWVIEADRRYRRWNAAGIRRTDDDDKS